MKITKKELVKTAKEFNELMGLDPAIKTTKEATEEELLQQITIASEMLEEDDEISEAAEAVLDFIAEQENAEESPEEEDVEDDVDVDVEDEEIEAEEEDETTAQLVEKSDYRAMKAMVADYPEFKSIDINLYPIKKTEELRTLMLKVLAKAVEKETEAEVKKEEKNHTAKKDMVKKDTPAKKNADKPAPKKKEDKGISQTDFIRNAFASKMKREKLEKGLANQFDKSDKWAINRIKLYEQAYGECGVNDKKLASK